MVVGNWFVVIGFWFVDLSSAGRIEILPDSDTGHQVTLTFVLNGSQPGWDFNPSFIRGHRHSPVISIRN